MSTPTGTLGGLPLLASPPIGWTSTPGVDPSTRTFRMLAGDAAKLVALRGAPVVLRITPPGRPAKVVQRLFVVATRPDPNPALSLVEVSDGRLFWTRAHVVRTGYNVPRSTAIEQRLAPEGVPVQVQQTSAGLTWARWSLYPRRNPNRPWTAIQLLVDVISDVLGQVGSVSAGLRFAAPLKRAARIVGVSFDDPGPSAIQRALAFLPGAQVTLDDDGRVVVFDELDGSGATLAAGAPIYNAARAGVLRLGGLRPRAVRVLFDRRVEVRFNSESETAAQIGVQDVGTTGRERTMANVAPVSEPSLVVKGQVLAAGSWVRIADLVGAYPTPAAGLPRVSLAVIRKGYLVPQFLEAYARPPGARTPDQTWANRIAAVVAHYRTTWQIKPYWMDLIREIKDSRVSILDPARLTRGRAQVFADYAVIPGVLGKLRAAAEGDTAAAWNVFGFASDLKNAKSAAPATVSILDSDQGILHFDYRLDPAGELAQIVPAPLLGPDGLAATIPTQDLARAQTGRGAKLLTCYCALSGVHSAAVVLTAVPGAPNDEATCYPVVVSADDAGRALGIDVGECSGPVWTIRVGPSVLTADHEWDDRSAAAFDQAFGARPGADGEARVSLALGSPINADLVLEVARAAAAALYSGLLDRLEGQHVVPWDPTRTPRGNATTVEHVVPPAGGGVPRTVVSFPRYVRGVDVFGVLPESVRQKLLGGPLP